ncbi:MAG: DMT family transporter [Armatimonadota bacterium]
MRRAYAYILVVVLCWGISLPGSKALLLAERGGERLSPLQVAFWSISAGWVALLVVLAVRRRVAAIGAVERKSWLVLVAMGFFGWAGYAVSLNTAFVRLPLPDAIIINYLHPVFAVAFQGSGFDRAVRAVLRLGREEAAAAPMPAARLAAGLALCLSGVALIATGGHISRIGSLGSSWGALAALFAAFSWGVYSNLGRFVRMRPGAEDRGGGDIQSWLAMSLGLAMMGAVLALGGGFGWPSGHVVALYAGPSGPYRASAWGIIGVMGVLPYCTGYTLWLMGLEIGRRFGEAHRLPPITYLTPVLGVALGWVALREPFGAGFWGGAALIAAGNAVIALRQRGSARVAA